MTPTTTDTPTREMLERQGFVRAIRHAPTERFALGRALVAFGRMPSAG